MKSPFIATKVALKGMTFLSASSAETWPMETLVKPPCRVKRDRAAVFFCLFGKKGFWMVGSWMISSFMRHKLVPWNEAKVFNGKKTDMRSFSSI